MCDMDVHTYARMCSPARVRTEARGPCQCFPLLLATFLFHFMTSSTHKATYQQPHLQTPSSTTSFPFIRSRAQTVNYQYQHATVYGRTDECERQAREEADKVRAEWRFQSLDGSGGQADMKAAWLTSPRIQCDGDVARQDSCD